MRKIEMGRRWLWTVGRGGGEEEGEISNPPHSKR